MALPETLPLVVGISRGVRRGHDLLCLAAAGAVVSSGGARGAVLASLAALAAAFAVSRWRLNCAVLRGRLQLRQDGSGTLIRRGGGSEVVLRTGGWCSGWLCVLPLRELLSGEPLHAVICRSLNSPDVYRWLLISLRTRTAGQDRGQGMFR